MKVLFSATFQKQALTMDRADAKLVGAVLSWLQLTDVPFGKRLSGQLHNCYAIRVGLNHRLRLVYEFQELDARVLVVGPRERGIVYIQAIQVLKELER